MSKLLRDQNDVISRPEHDDVAPGRGTLTSRLVPPSRTIVLRVESAEAARELAGAFGPRDANGVAAGADAAIDRAASSSGQSLPGDVRSRFEASTGADLSTVRVHTGAESAAAAAAVGAHAYTTGQDIHFAEGKYAPADPFGLHLLAHEVAHTVQQAGGAASGRQNKLEVSTPGDAMEVAADRAADAMVRGGAVDIGGATGTARKAIFRDGPPPADPKAADPKAAPGGQPGAAGGDKVNLDWWINWENKETGQTVQNKSNARTGQDAATGTLKVIPDAAGGDQPGILKWTNAASSGAVEVGKVPQAKDKGGQVSTDVAWGKKPSVVASVTVQETADDPKRVGQSQQPAKQKLASQAVSDKLDTDLDKMGDMGKVQADLQAAAVAAVGTGGEGFSYNVNVAVKPGALDGGAGNPKALTPVSYDGASVDGRRTAMVSVQTDIQKIKGTATVENATKDGNQTANQHSDEKKDSQSQSTTVTTEFINSVTTQIQSAFSSAFMDASKKATKDSGTLSGSFKGTLMGDTKASGKVTDLEVDVGAILGAILIEDPSLAYLVSKAVGKAKIGGELGVELAGALTVKADATKQWSNEEIQQKLSKQSASFSSKVNSTVSTTVNSTFTQSSSSSSAQANANQAAQQHEDQHKSASTTETVGVKYVIGEPKLTVTNG